MQKQELLYKLSEKLDGEFYYDIKNTKHHSVLIAYSTDASVYQQMPLAVAIAKTKEDLVTLIGFANENKVTLIPRAAGTSLAGQVVGQGIVVDISRYFTGILEVNQKEKWVRVEPGVIRDDLNKYLKPYGLMFGPETSTASRANIGGMIGNNSCGLHSMVWGDTRKHLLEAKVLLDDGSEAEFTALDNQEYFKKLSLKNREGELYRELNDLITNPENITAIHAGYPKKSIERRNTGYALDSLLEDDEPFNMCKLLAGSEGTLAIVTEAKLQLIDLPAPEIGVLCVHFKDMVECMHGNVVALKHNPLASELVDKFVMDFTKDHPTYKHNRFFIEGDPEALLMIEFRSHDLEDIQARADLLVQDLKQHNLGYAYPLITGPKTDLVWDVRKAGLGLIRNLPGDTQAVNLIEDCAVSPEDLPLYVAEVQELLKQEGLQASYYAHAGAGELHIEPFINLKSDEGRVQFRRVLEKTTDLIVKYNGSLSGEHGDGRLRGEFIPKVLGDDVYKLLEQVKGIFDKNGVFNTGKIVDTPAMDEDLRYQAHDNPKKVDTLFDFSAQEGILRLAEKCSGSGDCRKTHLSGGTMCPSYMATRNEEHTTRARANLLRKYLTNSPSENPFDHPEIKEVMDLCLSCKACKSECPSKVDVTKMKAEFLQHYYDANGSPLRSRLIANFTSMQMMASKVAPLYNWAINNALTSSLIKKFAGFAPKRSLPKVYGMTLERWIAKQAAITTSKKRIYLFCDEFTNYNDTPIGIAAYKLLTALGYQVVVPEHIESGRTFLSKGFVRKAKEIAEKNIALLKDLISEDTPLIGIEPSAILTFRDEYLDLTRGEIKEQARKIAANTFLIEEFLLSEFERGNIQAGQFENTPKKVKLHAHCYQKAFQLDGISKQILNIPVGYSVEVIPSGCCGMAGSFGYEKEHYKVSMQVADLVLMPTLKRTPDEDLIAAPGTSCRHQIWDGLQRKSYHPVEILYKALIK